MAEPDYAAALAVATNYHTQLIEGLAVDLVEAQNSRHRVQEIVEDYAHKLWQAHEVVCTLSGKKASKDLADLQQRAGLAPQPENLPAPKPRSVMRAATIMCLPDRITDSVSSASLNGRLAQLCCIGCGGKVKMRADSLQCFAGGRSNTRDRMSRDGNQRVLSKAIRRGDRACAAPG
jgi:hypothetical protein